VIETQYLRNNIEPETIKSFLSSEELSVIHLQHNHHLFFSLVTSKRALRSKNNYIAATQAARVDEIYTKKNGSSDFFIATIFTATVEELRERVKAFRKKAAALTKQADEYEKAAGLLEMGEFPEIDTFSDTTMLRMTYIHEHLSTRKDIKAYIVAHEAHLIATAEKLRGEMSGLAAYVNRAKKILEDKLRTITAVNEKILRDIVMYESFEVKTWQMKTLPSKLHKCQCARCMQKEILAPAFTKYILSNLKDCQPKSRDDASASLSQLNDDGELMFKKEVSDKKIDISSMKKHGKAASGKFSSLAEAFKAMIISDDDADKKEDDNSQVSKLVRTNASEPSSIATEIADMVTFNTTSINVG